MIKIDKIYELNCMKFLYGSTLDIKFRNIVDQKRIYVITCIYVF